MLYVTRYMKLIMKLFWRAVLYFLCLFITEEFKKYIQDNSRILKVSVEIYLIWYFRLSDSFRRDPFPRLPAKRDLTPFFIKNTKKPNLIVTNEYSLVNVWICVLFCLIANRGILMIRQESIRQAGVQGEVILM